METKREQERVYTGARRLGNVFSTFTCCLRRVFLCVDRLGEDEGHCAMPILGLRCLRR